MIKITKWLIGIILISLIVLTAIAVVDYKLGSNWPFSQKRIPLTPKGKESLSKRFGISFGGSWPELSDKELNDALDDIAEVGFTWVRFDMDWGQAQPENNGRYHWQKFDMIVTAANKRKLKILPILTYAPNWAGKSHNQKNYMSSSANQAFANFAQEAVKRYAPLGVHAWEIWNEPNLKGSWEPAPNPKDYADLLKRSYIKIKQVDPGAIVISGGLAALAYNRPGVISGLNFLEGIYANGAKNYFDGVGYHPFSFPRLPRTIITGGGWSQLERPFFKSVRSIMADNDDDIKPVWATEFGVPTRGVNDVSESLQVKMVEDVVAQMQIKPWIKVLFWYSYKDLSNHQVPAENYFGIVRNDGTKKPAYFTIKNLLRNH